MTGAISSLPHAIWSSCIAMICRRCSAENDSGRLFCSACGEALPHGCVRCGFVNKPLDHFCGGCGAPLGSAPSGDGPVAYTPKHLADRVLTTRSALEGERKRVTVLFCDVVESYRLAEQLGPEGMHEIMDQALRLMAEAVHRYEGTVNQFLGDGLMALFGAPVALEQHALRAIYAALEFATRCGPSTSAPGHGRAPPCACGWDSTAGWSSSAASGTISAWTTPRSVTPPISPLGFRSRRPR